MVSSRGALNTFSFFSQHLKLWLEYNEKDMNTISFFKDVGTSVGILSGLVYDMTGPWLVLLLGFSTNLFGYLMIWLATTQRISHPEVWAMSVYLCLIGASAVFTTTAVLVACGKNFPKNQGTILSLLDSTHGLRAAVFTFLYQALYPGASILLFSSSPGSPLSSVCYPCSSLDQSPTPDTTTTREFSTSSFLKTGTQAH